MTIYRFNEVNQLTGEKEVIYTASCDGACLTDELISTKSFHALKTKMKFDGWKTFKNVFLGGNRQMRKKAEESTIHICTMCAVNLGDQLERIEVNEDQLRQGEQ